MADRRGFRSDDDEDASGSITTMQASGPTVGTGTGGAGEGGVGGAPSGPATGGGPEGGCFSEAFVPGAPLADLEASYAQSSWLASMMGTLDRRYPAGHLVLDAMQTDPWLTSQFPQYFDLSSWSGMIESIDTACHEELHGYDFDAALSTPGSHVYLMGSEEVVAPKLSFFARSSILPLVQASGSVTTSYDGTYLTGQQGSYDFIFLADELNAYTTGLACATSVVDQLPGYGYSYRDGAAAHLLYLELYLRVARTEHAALYDAWKADPAWQRFVRLAWARGRFWYGVALAHPALGIGDAAIWSRLELPENRDEIALFTGTDPDDVACHP